MSQENKNIKLSGQDKGDGSRKGPKFNIYWIYAIILVVLLGTQFMKLSPDLIIITEQEFTKNRQKVIFKLIVKNDTIIV